jgi:glucan biosynthesis protein C
MTGFLPAHTGPNRLPDVLSGTLPDTDVLSTTPPDTDVLPGTPPDTDVLSGTPPDTSASPPGHGPGQPRPQARTARPDVRTKDRSIETLRGLAIFAVVVGHVIGNSGDRGMRVDPGSIYRHVYDATTYLRMPLFFVISGFLYAYRPVVPGKFAEFARGKARLLVLPYLSVATLQFLMRTLIPDAHSGAWLRNLWEIYVYGFDQFWFSQVAISTFVILLVCEKLFAFPGRSRWPVYWFLSLLFYFVNPQVYVFSFIFLSEMLPFFFLGCLLYRPPACLEGRPAVAAAGLLLVAGLTAQQLVWFGHFAPSPWMILLLQIGEGSGFAFLLFRFRWTSPGLAMLGGYAYPIYLFHVFGTAGSRILLGRLGLENRVALLAIGTVSGLVLPILVDRSFRRNVVLRRVFLGAR